MAGIPSEIARLGGAAKAIELRAAGATAGAIRSALRSGAVVRPRKGWYVLPGIPVDLIEVVRVGGRATCVTALIHFGVWITATPSRVHVAVHPSACQLRSSIDSHLRQTVMADAVVHWSVTPKPRDPKGSRLTEPVLVALRDAADCLSPEDLFATAESILAARMVGRSAWVEFLAGIHARHRALLATCGRLSGSGTESIFLFRTRGRFGVRQQVRIGLDRVDFLIGDRLVVEIDSREFHDRRRDYERDARLTARGYQVLRFDYRQIMFDWPRVEASVAAAASRA